MQLQPRCNAGSEHIGCLIGKRFSGKMYLGQCIAWLPAGSAENRYGILVGQDEYKVIFHDNDVHLLSHVDLLECKKNVKPSLTTAKNLKALKGYVEVWQQTYDRVAEQAVAERSGKEDNQQQEAQFFPATIREVKGDGSFFVAWDDGYGLDRTKGACELQRLECAEGKAHPGGAANKGQAAAEIANPAGVDERNFFRILAEALILKFQYLLANEGMVLAKRGGKRVTVGDLIDSGMKALEGGLYGEAIRVSQLLMVLQQCGVAQPIFGDAIFDATNDRGGSVERILGDNNGRVAVNRFHIPIFFTVNRTRNGAGVNRCAGILEVTHVSLIENAQVEPWRGALHLYRRHVCSALILTWRSQERCAALPGMGGLTWVQCYLDRIEKVYQDRCRAARAGGGTSPPAPEQRVVLEGNFVRCTQARDLVVAPCQTHRDEGPYDLPQDWVKQCFQRFR